MSDKEVVFWNIWVTPKFIRKQTAQLINELKTWEYNSSRKDTWMENKHIKCVQYYYSLESTN